MKTYTPKMERSILKPNFLYFLISFATIVNGFDLHAQVDQTTNELVISSKRISSDSHSDSIQKLLKQCKASKIEFNTLKNSAYPFRIKRKKNWALVSEVWDYTQLEGTMEEDSIQLNNLYFKGYRIHELKNYSLLFPDAVLEQNFRQITVGEQKKKKYIVNPYTADASNAVWFDELNIVTQTDTMESYIDDGTDEMMQILYGYTFEKYVELKRANTWALGYLTDAELFQLSGFHFNRDQIPDSLINKYLTYYSDIDNRTIDTSLAKTTSALLTLAPEMDIVQPLWRTSTNLQLLLIRHATTKRWSIVTPGLKAPANIILLGSAQKIIPHTDYLQFVEVWCEDKVGFYNAEMTANQPCEYDEIQIVNLDYLYALALKKDGLWSFYNPEDASLLFKGTADTIEGLIEKWLNK